LNKAKDGDASNGVRSKQTAIQTRKHYLCDKPPQREPAALFGESNAAGKPESKKNLYKFR
jgi:hypothetical protein